MDKHHICADIHLINEDDDNCCSRRSWPFIPRVGDIIIVPFLENGVGGDWSVKSVSYLGHVPTVLVNLEKVT